MAKLTDARVATLKGYFNIGDQPTEAQFANLIQWTQEGIEEHDHDATGDGDGIKTLAGTLTLDVGTGKVMINTVTLPSGMFAIEGTDSSYTDGPHVRFTTDADVFPTMLIFNYAHDNGIGIVLDAFYDGAWKSSDAGSNFRIFKYDDVLHFEYDQGIAQNAAVTFEDGIVLTAVGNVGIGILAPAGKTHIDQATADAAIPVLILDQADVSEGFINFIGSDRGVIGEGTNSVESVRVEVNGVVRRIAVYADA